MVKTLLVVLALSSIAMSDYDADLLRLRKQIEGTPNDPVKRAALLYRHASLTVDFSELREAERAIDHAIEVAPSRDLLLLRANFNFKMHRLQRAKEDLAPEDLLNAQVAMQEGDYETAERMYRAIVEKTHTWDSIASLAYYKSVTGDPDGADRLYVEAEDEITAKEMRSYAWVEVQRGIIDLEHHRYAGALVHYQRADSAYSGYWLVEEHIAEVLDKLGRTSESIALYQRIIDRTHNPEYIGALAAIVGRTDPAAAAKLWTEADALYESQMRLYPEAAGGHLIRHLLAHPDAPLPQLIALAEQNMRIRPNGEAKMLLAKAYWKAKRPADAKRILGEVMSTRWRTPELAAFAQSLRNAAETAMSAGSQR